MTTSDIEDVLIEVDGSVVYATLDRPQTRNAISLGMVAGLEAAVTTARATCARVLVLRGSRGNFCSGADLGFVEKIADNSDELEEYIFRLGQVMNDLGSGDFVSVAVIEGYALAGGCEMLLACDLSVASDDAKIGDRHVELGLVAGAGGSVRLLRSLSAARRNWLLFTGEMLSGKVAAEWGLVTMSVPAADLDGVVDKLVARVASRSAASLAVVRRMILSARDQSFDDALDEERRLYFQHMASDPDAREGLVAFRERRSPRFVGAAD